MVTVSTVRQTIAMLVVAALVGALGAFAGELVAVRGKARDTGVIERSRRLSERYRDLGSWAAPLVGIVAGPLAVFLASPVKTGANGVRQYALERLVGIALAAGIAGPVFVRQAGARFVAELDAERKEHALGLVRAANLADVGATPDPAAPARRAVTGAAASAATTERLLAQRDTVRALLDAATRDGGSAER